MAANMSIETNSGSFSVLDVLSYSLPTAAFQDNNAIGETLLHFWTQNLMIDVNFKIKSEDDWLLFSAHKVILSIWSPVLADILYKDAEVENPIEITDVSPAAFETMLKFMYGSRAELHRQRKEGKFILQVYKVADKYQVEALRLMCFDMLFNTTPNTHNVFDVLDASKVIGSTLLEQRCYKVLQSQTAQVLTHQDLSCTTPDRIKIILNLSSVSFSCEYELILWVLAWAKNNYLKNLQDYRSILSEVVPFLKFTSLTSKEFSKILHDHMEFIDEKDGFSIFMNIEIPGSHPLPEWCVASQKTKRKYSVIE